MNSALADSVAFAIGVRRSLAERPERMVKVKPTVSGAIVEYHAASARGIIGRLTALGYDARRGPETASGPGDVRGTIAVHAGGRDE